MNINFFKKIFLKGKILKYSFWEKITKRKIHQIKSIFFNNKTIIIPFPFKNWDIITPQSKPPEEIGWEPLWHGYWEMKKTLSEEFRDFCKKTHNYEDGLTEEELEKQCFLSIIKEVKDEEIKMFELGAGSGRECLTLAGVVDFKLIPSLENKKYRCLALEAEPIHHEWLCEHFKKQKINGNPVLGAVTGKEGYVFFDNSLDPASFYGQSITEDNKGYKVKSYTVDGLLKEYNFSKVNIIHLDVQGNELKAVQGAKESIKLSLIDYWIIGTHEKYLGEEIINFTKNFYDVILYMPHRSGVIKHNFYGKVFIPQDGLLILRNKKLLN